MANVEEFRPGRAVKIISNCFSSLITVDKKSVIELDAYCFI